MTSMATPYTLTVRNVNQALAEMLWLLKVSGIEEPSRNGPVLLMPTPVIVTYRYPTERVLFSKERDANPFFHFMESLWMLAGRNDVAWIQTYNSRMGEYSDDKVTQWGAYGYRWRKFFGHDQLQDIIAHLRGTPTSRRAVLAMWSPDGDLWMKQDAAGLYTLGGLGSRDVPCNTHIYFAIHDGQLNMTVCNRSNDAIWGAFGANAVHMAFLQEYVATHLGVEVGVYYQFSNNMHIYTEKFGEDKRMRIATGMDERYSTGTVEPLPLIQAGETMEEWDRDLRCFFEDPLRGSYYTDFFEYTVMPMYFAWKHRKEGVSNGIADAKEIAAKDWRVACIEWLDRREYDRLTKSAFVPFLDEARHEGVQP